MPSYASSFVKGGWKPDLPEISISIPDLGNVIELGAEVAGQVAGAVSGAVTDSFGEFQRGLPVAIDRIGRAGHAITESVGLVGAQLQGKNTKTVAGSQLFGIPEALNILTTGEQHIGPGEGLAGGTGGFLGEGAKEIRVSREDLPPPLGFDIPDEHADILVGALAVGVAAAVTWAAAPAVGVGLAAVGIVGPVLLVVGAAYLIAVKVWGPDAVHKWLEDRKKEMQRFFEGGGQAAALRGGR